MSFLPYTSVVDANINTNALASQRKSFGVLNIITKETSDNIPSAVRYKLYTHIDEVAADWEASTAVSYTHLTLPTICSV